MRPETHVIERAGFFATLLFCEAAATSIDPEMLERRVRRLAGAVGKRRTGWEKPGDLVERHAGRRPFDVFSRQSLEACTRWGLMARDDGRFDLACSPETEANYYTTSLSDVGSGVIERRLAGIPAAGTRRTFVRGRRSPFREEPHQKQIAPLQAELVHVDGGQVLPQEDPDRTAKLRERLLSAGSSI